jgi:hypothetical protein
LARRDCCDVVVGAPRDAGYVSAGPPVSV